MIVGNSEAGYLHKKNICCLHPWIQEWSEFQANDCQAYTSRHIWANKLQTTSGLLYFSTGIDYHFSMMFNLCTRRCSSNTFFLLFLYSQAAHFYTSQRTTQSHFVHFNSSHPSQGMWRKSKTTPKSLMAPWRLSHLPLQMAFKLFQSIKCNATVAIYTSLIPGKESEMKSPKVWPLGCKQS